MAAIVETFEQANVTVGPACMSSSSFSKPVDEVRKADSQARTPCSRRYAGPCERPPILQTDDQASLGAGRTRGHRPVHRRSAWRIKEKLRWIRKAEGVHAARWRITNCHPTYPSMHRLRSPLGAGQMKRSKPSTSTSVASFSAGRQAYSNARMEGLNGSLRSRSSVRLAGYRNTATYIRHDLPDSRPERKPLRFHLKRRRTILKHRRRRFHIPVTDGSIRWKRRFVFRFALSSRRWWRRNCWPRSAGATATNARVRPRAIATATGIGSLSGPSVNRGFRCRAPG